MLDIGANIGLTALAFSSLCPSGTIIAVEAGRKAFEYLVSNIRENAIDNVRAFNFAAGSKAGFARLYVDDANLASAFVIGIAASAGDAGLATPMHPIDDAFPEFGIDRVDVIKIDVEGFELEVLRGAGEILERFKPIVYMEMNHWCLNAFRRIALPDFYDEIFNVFPVIYAIDGTSCLDFRLPENRGRIFHEHIVQQKWTNIVCGFDRQAVEARLAAFHDRQSSGVTTAPEAACRCENRLRTEDENAKLRTECQDLRQALDVALLRADAYRDSSSWKLTAPLRALANARLLSRFRR